MKYNLIKIREGRVEDLTNVFNLIKELAKYENALHSVKINIETLAKDGYGGNPQFKIFVAECDSKLIGMGLVYFRYSTWKGKRLYLEDLIVNKIIILSAIDNLIKGGAGQAVQNLNLKFNFPKNHALI